MRVLSVEQWRTRGIDRDLVRSLTHSGDLVWQRRGVYATTSAVQWAGDDQVRCHVLRILAVRAAVGRHAVASFHSAAVVHRLDLLQAPPADTVTLTLPPDKRWKRAQPSDVVFHSAELPAGQVTTRYNLPLTSVARTVADLARTLPFAAAVVTADSALREEKLTRTELGHVLDECGRWPGVRQARRVQAFADERAESPLESVARVAFDQLSLAPPELQATIFTPGSAFRVDFLWREHKVVAEADGLAKYADSASMTRQFERDRLLRDAG